MKFLDLQCATDMGIAVYTLGGCCTEEVADSTMCHILNLYRRVSFLNDAVKTGKKPQNAEQVRELADGCMRIRGEKLGIVGLGSVGTAVAMRARVFGFDVGYFDPELPDGRGASLGLKRYKSLQELLFASDCVTVHCTLNRGTQNMFNEYAFEKMRKVKFIRQVVFSHLLGRILHKYSTRGPSGRTGTDKRFEGMFKFLINQDLIFL